MKVLLDTNIVIHREASRIVNQDIGVLFYWLDKLFYKKCIHPITAEELNRNANTETAYTMQLKLKNYHLLKTPASLHENVNRVCSEFDKTPNDSNDTKLLNEVFCNRVDFFITEDKKIHKKSFALGIDDKVFSIDSFLEKATSENPELINYEVLSVRKMGFGQINLDVDFFDSLKRDYRGADNDFVKWFNSKAGDNEEAYVCYEGETLKAFLYIKFEGEAEVFSDIDPPFKKKKRLKIGTFKVVSNGYRLGERLLKIVFDNAWVRKVDEIYVTVFNTRPDLLALIAFIEQFGFKHYGLKSSSFGTEQVYVRDFSKGANLESPRLTFPWMSPDSDVFIVPIQPSYHKELFPDSKLKTESFDDFVDNEPHRNAISKSYISHSRTRNLKSGDIIVFYRSGDRIPKIHSGVATTIGIVEKVLTDIRDVSHLEKICRGRSALTIKELNEYWNRFPTYRPFVINFLYAFSFKKRITLKQMLDSGILPDMEHVKTITKIDRKSLTELIKLAGI